MLYPTTLVKLVRRAGPEVIDELNAALLAKLAAWYERVELDRDRTVVTCSPRSRFLRATHVW